MVDGGLACVSADRAIQFGVMFGILVVQSELDCVWAAGRYCQRWKSALGYWGFRVLMRF